MKQVLSLLFIIVVLAQFQTLTVGCANIIPPTGGPRDSLPPVLLKAAPRDSTRNFTGKKITFEFDEFVDLDNIQENLLVSPVPKINPIVERKLRVVTVTIKDTLEENTTYTLDFGKGIKDINEGNALKNFTYVFSTGHQIDSLSVSGKVIIAETGKSDSTLIVVLHSSINDSAVIKERPRYVTKLDSAGNFHFRNLPADTYAMYALKDEGGQRKFMSNSQLFAFADSLVNTTDASKSYTLYAYLERDKDTVKKAPPAAAPAAPRPAGNKNNAKEQDKRLRIETNLSGQELDLLDSLKLSFKEPLRNFDSSRVRFVNEKFEPVVGYKLLQDTSKKKITFVYPWPENTPYNLIFDKDFAEDTLGHKLIRTDTLEFRTKKSSDYGLVRLRFLNLDLSKNPVLQFVQGDQVKYSHVFKDRTFNAKLFVPGEYDLRIVYDANKNGVWDPGDFFGKRIQPELVLPVSRKLNVKANWDNEIDITL